MLSAYSNRALRRTEDGAAKAGRRIASLRNRRSASANARIALLSLAYMAATACASASAAKKAPPDFAGAWSVEWCDRTNPNLDCGGFDITLVQEGDRLCGDFGGALVNLRQIDEGRIVGTAVGDTAVLTVRSNRNLSIVLVRAKRVGNRLHWRTVDEVKRAENDDIDVIATDDVLIRQPATDKKTGRVVDERRTCADF